MVHTAYINSAGEIQQILLATSEASQPEGLNDAGVLLKHIDVGSQDPASYVETHYFHHGSETMKTRSKRPHEYATWNVGTEEWEVTLDNYLIPIRAARDLRLQLSDWTQLADNVLTSEKKAEWQTYRQLLREVPNSVIVNPTNYLNFTNTVAWPTPPS